MASLTQPAAGRRDSRVRSVEPLVAVRLAAYGLATAAVYVTFGFLWYYAAKEKLIDQDGVMPAGLVKAFHGSFITSVLGDNGAWTVLGAMEAVACVLFAASLARGEFLPQRDKPVLVGAVAFSALTFAVMAFASDMTGDFSTAAELYQYLVGSVVVGAAVMYGTPSRLRRWVATGAPTPSRRSDGA